MALTVSTNHTVPTKDADLVFATVTFDSSYPTGGETVKASDFGLNSIITVIVSQPNVAGVDAVWDGANSKLKLFDEDNTTGIAAEFANTGDASGVSVDVIAVGT